MRRRDFLRVAAGGAAGLVFAQSAPPPLARAVIPASGQQIARVGLGTWQVFDVGADATRRAALAAVLAEFATAGGDVIDTSPMYGTSEEVLGDLLGAAGLRGKCFLATKVWIQGQAAGIAQMEDSLRKLRTPRVELMQIHNLVDWETQLKTLRAWKEHGRIRHLGLTHYAPGAAAELARVVRREQVDFVQYALSLEEREATQELLTLCADRGVAFLANRPFGGGGALGRLRGKPVPALGYDSWAQLLLAWVLSFPEVTCAIPGTSKVEHLRDNLNTARKPAPDVALRRKIEEAWKAA